MRHPSRRSAVALAAIAATLAGCFTTTADFRNDAETFIVENDELRAAIFPDSPDDAFVDSTCADPENQDVGTTFDCDATDSNGEVWEFEIVITSSSEYEVNLSRSPEGA